MTLRNFVLGFAASIALGASSIANAFVITAGDIKISFDAYDAGTFGYTVGGDPTASGIACNTVATCDAAAAFPSPGAVGSEDTWGIFSISNISNISTGDTLFTKGTDGYLIGMFFGLEDFTVERLVGLTTDITTAFSQGGSILVYESADDYDPTAGPAGRTGLSSYTDIPGAGDSLWLSADFVPGASAGVPTATYVSTFDSNTVAGQGSGYLSVTGGSIASQLDTNGFLGGSADLFLTTTFDDVNGAASDLDWTVKAVGQVSAEAIPTPGTLALMGLALAGLGFSRRLRRS